VEIADHGSRLRLAGMAVDAVLVPQLLKRLADGAQLAGSRFNTFEVTADSAGTASFVIAGPAQDGQ
jgi:hypothetical protein